MGKLLKYFYNYLYVHIYTNKTRKTSFKFGSQRVDSKID